MFGIPTPALKTPEKPTNDGWTREQKDRLARARAFIFKECGKNSRTEWIALQMYKFAEEEVNASKG